MEKYLYFDLYQKEEVHWWHKAKRYILFDLIKKYCPAEKLVVLDIGCGTGLNLDYLTKTNDAYGIDISSEAIKFCKKRRLKKVFVSSAENTNFPDNFFDLVIMLDVLEHTFDEKTMKEIRRILKPKGIIILTVPAFRILWSKWDEVLHHRKRYTKQDIQTLCVKNFLDVLHISYAFSFLFLPALVVRKIKSKIFKKSFYPSDFEINSKIINYFLYPLSKIDFKINSFLSIPFGTSVVCVAQKSLQI